MHIHFQNVHAYIYTPLNITFQNAIYQMTKFSPDKIQHLLFKTSETSTVQTVQYTWHRQKHKIAQSALFWPEIASWSKIQQTDNCCHQQ